MKRVGALITAAITLAVAGLVVLNVVQNPFAQQVAGLDERLATVRAAERNGAEEAGESSPLATLKEHQHLWERLTTPPPPPAPPKAKEPEPPSLVFLLKDVKPTTSQVGDKVKIRTPKNTRGDFYAVGDEVINGVVVKEITQDAVVFALDWRHRELRHKIQRQ